jgi:hypothetical protein
LWVRNGSLPGTLCGSGTSPLCDTGFLFFWRAVQPNLTARGVPCCRVAARPSVLSPRPPIVLDLGAMRVSGVPASGRERTSGKTRFGWQCLRHCRRVSAPSPEWNPSGLGLANGRRNEACAKIPYSTKIGVWVHRQPADWSLPLRDAAQFRSAIRSMILVRCQGKRSPRPGFRAWSIMALWLRNCPSIRLAPFESGARP